MFEPDFENTSFAQIKVIGVGGAGCNAIAAYVALYSLSDWNTLRGYPNRDTLASHLGISRSSVINFGSPLKAASFTETEAHTRVCLRS